MNSRKMKSKCIRTNIVTTDRKKLRYLQEEMSLRGKTWPCDVEESWGIWDTRLGRK